MAGFLSALIYFLLTIMSVFLICLVLIQRGKGGGLAGAFGGVGGSSAFGTKAGDVFTRVTMITAGIWIALNMVLVVLSNQRESAWGDTPTPGSASKSSFTPGTAPPADGKAAIPGADGKAAPGLGGSGTLKGGPLPLPPQMAPVIGQPAAGAAAGDGLPADPFESGTRTAPTPLSPTPAGSTPSGGGNNPKP